MLAPDRLTSPLVRKPLRRKTPPLTSILSALSAYSPRLEK